MASTSYTPIPVPVTLNCSGGISLGAYMAGVIYELVREARSDQPLIEIDVITGASAGAITGLIAAYYLLLPKVKKADAKAAKADANDAKIDSVDPNSEIIGHSLNDATGNAFYKIWVDKADISQLRRGKPLGGWFSSRYLKKSDDEDGKKYNGVDGTFRSLLTSQPIKQEAETLLNWQHLQQLPTEAVNGPETASDEISKTTPLALIMTVTNLSGLLKNSDLKSQKALSYAETRRFLFSNKLIQDTTRNSTNQTKLEKIWSKALLSAQASSAFPGAFLPVVDDSDECHYNFSDCYGNYEEEFAKAKVKDVGAAQTQSHSKICMIDQPQLKHQERKFLFAYTDGGVLDNLPIIQGIDFLRELLNKKNHSREVHADGSYAADLGAFQAEWDQRTDRKYIEQRRKYIYVQPQPYKSLQDDENLTTNYFSWLQTLWRGLNIPHAEHDYLRLEEVEMINDTYRAFESLKPYCNDVNKVDRRNPYVPVDLEPIDPSLLFDLQKSNANAEIYQKLKEQGLFLEGEPNCKGLLASDLLSGFGGFFQKEFRDHDFVLGRLSALTWLQHTFANDISRMVGKELPMKDASDLIETHVLNGPHKLNPCSKFRLFKLGLSAVLLAIFEIIFGLLKMGFANKQRST